MGDSIEKPGVLILVAGPSGSGKDTLISAARRALAANSDFVFPSRIITRADQTGEEHIHIWQRDFERFRSEELFFLDWDAHGFSYGIAANVQDDLDAGRAVIFNVSRRMIPEARRKWCRTAVISVRAASGALRSRLRARGRESEAEIEARIRRAEDSACAIDGPVHDLDNSGSLDDAIAVFLEFLLWLREGVPAESMPANDLESAAALRLA